MHYLLSLLWLILMMCVTAHAQEIVFTPHWVVQSQFAGFYVADSLGYYKEEGLDVKIIHPSITKNVLHSLKEGSSHVITSNLSQALSFNSTDADIVNIMQLSQTNSLMLVGRFPLKDMNSLKNQTIGVWSYIDPKILDAMNLKYGLNIKWVRFNSGVNIFTSKAIDIILVGGCDEFHLFKECGVNIKPDHIYNLKDNGYDIPKEGVYVTREYYLKHKEALQKFVKASKRGWEWANENIEKTVDFVMARDVDNSVATNRYHQRMVLKGFLQNHLHPKSNTRTYRLQEEDYKRAVNFMLPVQKGEALDYDDFVKN